MGAVRVIGGVLLVLSVPALLAAMLALFSESSPVPPFVQDDDTQTGYALAGIGVGFLVIGFLLLILSPRAKPMVVVQPVAAPAPQVEIKRTEMNWGSNAAASPSDELQAELDAVNQKIGQAKVRYGVGEISAETYKMLVADYEKERAEIQRRILEMQR